MNISDLYTIFLEYSTICTDSRNIIPDSIFFALKGENFDGNKYVKQALETGCAYAVSDDKSNEGINGCIIVENVLKTLQQLAEYHRLELNIPVLAITGTNGKTTTKELVSAVLSQKYNVVSTKGNFNNHIGVPLTLLLLNKNTEIAIIEMGANHIGEIASLCEIAHPNAGIITNIGKAHLEGFGSEEGVKKAKGELYDYLEKNRGVVFYNSDDNLLKNMAEKTENTVLYAYGKSLYDVQINNNAILAFTTKNPLLDISTKLVGQYNLYNALAAIAVGIHYEVPEAQIEYALNNYTPANNRSQLINTANNTVIMDAYNANPSSMEAAIINFSKLSRNNKMLILGDMLELGGSSLEEHKNIIDLAKKYQFQNLILVGPKFYELKTEISSYKYFPDRNRAEEYLKNNNLKSFTILIKGSRGIGLENLLEYL